MLYKIIPRYGIGAQKCTTPIPAGELSCWEMYHKMKENSAELDQSNTSFVGILLGQTPAIGGGGRYNRVACRDVKQTCREVARARHMRETAFAAWTLRQPTP